MGDFNARWLPEMKSHLEKFGLFPVLDDGTPTHALGGQLDQIFTNLPVHSVKTVDAPFSDHKIIVAELAFEKQEDDLDIRNFKNAVT